MQLQVQVQVQGICYRLHMVAGFRAICLKGRLHKVAGFRANCLSGQLHRVAGFRATCLKGRLRKVAGFRDNCLMGGVVLCVGRLSHASGPNASGRGCVCQVTGHIVQCSAWASEPGICAVQCRCRTVFFP